MKGRRSARKKEKCHSTLLLCIGRAVEILSHKHDADDACRFCIDDECMFSASVQHNTTHKKRGGEGGDSSFFFCFVLFVTTLSRDRRDPLKAKRWEGAERGDERGEIEFNGRQRYSSPLARLLSSTMNRRVCRKKRASCDAKEWASLSTQTINACKSVI